MGHFEGGSGEEKEQEEEERDNILSLYCDERRAQAICHRIP